VCVCLADCDVYAWGNNAMGQCGLGHSQGPVTSPKLVTALRGSRVQQISAGTSHSLAWTAISSDRYPALCMICFQSLFLDATLIFADNRACSSAEVRSQSDSLEASA